MVIDVRKSIISFGVRTGWPLAFSAMILQPCNDFQVRSSLFNLHGPHISVDSRLYEVSPQTHKFRPKQRTIFTRDHSFPIWSVMPSNRSRFISSQGFFGVFRRTIYSNGQVLDLEKAKSAMECP
jgi:hypothetical protein